jgi:hypothetical protein
MSCGALRKPGIPKCWSCGFEAKRPNKVVTAPGKLSEVKRSPKVTMADKQAWWSGFLHEMQYKTKTQKWALAMYKQKFGVWPRGLRDIPMEPTPEMQSWLRSRQIAWSKSRYNPNNAEARP